MRRKFPPSPLTRARHPAEPQAGWRGAWRIAQETGAGNLPDEEPDGEVALARAQRLARLKRTARS